LIEQEEDTTSGLAFKRKRKATAPPTEHSHLDGQTLDQDIVPLEGQASHRDVIVIQEGEAESSKSKSLWEPSSDVPTYGEHVFLHRDDKDKLMALDEDHLLRDTMKQIWQTFAMGFLVVSKARIQKSAKDQRVVELQSEVKNLRVEINRLNDHAQVEATRLTNIQEETKRLMAEKAQEATSLVKEKDKLLSKIEELENEVTCLGEDLTKAWESFKQDVTQSYLVGFEAAIEQTLVIHSDLDYSKLGPGKNHSYQFFIYKIIKRFFYISIPCIFIKHLYHYNRFY